MDLRLIHVPQLALKAGQPGSQKPSRHCKPASGLHSTAQELYSLVLHEGVGAYQLAPALLCTGQSSNPGPQQPSGACMQAGSAEASLCR